MPADRHAMIRGVENIGILEFAHGLQFFQNASYLMVDVLGTGQLAPDLVADGHLVATLPHPADRHLVTQPGMAVVKRMFRQPVEGQLRGLRVGRRQGLLVAMIYCPVLLEQFGRTVPHVVRMGKAKVDEEGILVLGLFPVVQVIHHLLPMPVAARLLRAATLGGIVPHRELGVGSTVTISILAGPHGIVTGLVEDSGQAILDRIHDAGLFLLFLVPLSAGSLQVPDRAARHDHSPGGRTYRTGHRAHVVGLVKGHAFRRQFANGGSVQDRGRVVGLEVKGRLIVRDDEQNVRAFGIGRKNAEADK